MRASITKVVLVGVAGAGVAWLVSVALSPHELPTETPSDPRDTQSGGSAARAPGVEAEPARGSTTRAGGERGARDGEPRPAASAAPSAAPPPAEAPPETDAATAASSSDETGETGAAAIDVLPDNGVRDAPQRSTDDPARIDALLTAPRIWCDFGDGNNQGIRIGERLTTAGAAWMGGPLEFDLLDVDRGTARLVGSLGATGSRKGEVKMRVIVDGARVHFMGLLPTGTLQSITIYGDRSPNLGRDAGRHVAVLSRHEPSGFLTYGVQFLGSCE
jgi:hypothetical protein